MRLGAVSSIASFQLLLLLLPGLLPLGLLAAPAKQPSLWRSPTSAGGRSAGQQAASENCRRQLLALVTGNPTTSRWDMGDYLNRRVPGPLKAITGSTEHLRAHAWHATRYAQNRGSFCVAPALVRGEAELRNPLSPNFYAFQRFSGPQKDLYHDCYAGKRYDWMHSEDNLPLKVGLLQNECIAYVQVTGAYAASQKYFAGKARETAGPRNAAADAKGTPPK